MSVLTVSLPELAISPRVWREGPHFLLQAAPERAAREIQVFIEARAAG